MTKMEEILTEQQEQLRQQKQDMQGLKDRPGFSQPALPAGADNPTAQLLQLLDGDAEYNELARDLLATEKLDQPITGRMLQNILERVVSPILQKELSILHQRQNFTAQKIQHVQDEQKRALMRIAWLERDLLTLQTDLARRQLVIRNWPAWMSADERHENVRCICDKADVNLDLGFGVDGGGIGA